MSARATPCSSRPVPRAAKSTGLQFASTSTSWSTRWIPDGTRGAQRLARVTLLATPGDYSSGCEPCVESVLGVDRLDHRQGCSARHGRHARLRVSGWRGGNTGWYEDIVAQPTPRVVTTGGVDRQPVQGQGQSDVVGARRLPAPPTGSEGAARARAIADRIKSTGARQLFMAEASPPDSVPSEVPYFRSILDQNSFYGYGPDGRSAVYETADRAWTMSPPRPAWMQEGTHEYGQRRSLQRAAVGPRRGRFWSVLAGGTAGDGFGSSDVWQWKNIPSRCRALGQVLHVRVRALRFTPLVGGRAVRRGREAHGPRAHPSGNGRWAALDYDTSARTSDHQWLLAYVPVTESGRTFSVAMSALDGPIRARWFDPTTGNYIAISNGYVYENRRTRRFNTPGNGVTEPTTGSLSSIRPRQPEMRNDHHLWTL